MRKIIVGVILTLIFVFAFHYCANKREQKEQFTAQSALILNQIQNVGKLIVTESNYSKVFTFEDSKDYFFNSISFRKRALVVVNAKVTVSYDLKQLQTTLDPENKTVFITYVPKEELNIYPEITYYDVTQDYFNQFNAQDFNRIKGKVEQMLKQQVVQSTIKANAKNRLISELQNIYHLTSSMGWELRYNTEMIQSQTDFEVLNVTSSNHVNFKN